MPGCSWIRSAAVLSASLLIAGWPALAPAQVQCRNHNPQRAPFFGDLHVHTKYSLDANTQGTIIGPHEAYRFARGERIGIQPYNAAGEPLRHTQLSRPLDFAAVTDHAELFGETEICTNPQQRGYNSPECLLYRAAPAQAFTVFNLLGPGLFGIPTLGGETIPRLPFPKEQDFLRSALKEGLVQEQRLGVNPFKYGFVGSTDTHLGTPGLAREAEFPGHGGAGNAARDEVPPGLSDRIEYSPGGLAVLWAEQNTRESLFAAMRRREAYATSGTRPVVRFFGGWNLSMNQCASRDFAGDGYRNGVPMGGDLPARPGGGATPRFAVSALRDPGAAGEDVQPLQRIQIVKGWVENGQKRERVYEVAGNPDNDARVDLSTCATSGSGSASLCSVWEDPDFQATQSAFYYARVLENPSCRWATRQCLAARVDCASPDTVPREFADCCNAAYPKTVQERAWTSPIWYRPATK